jgi:hypothetical protein
MSESSSSQSVANADLIIRRTQEAINLLKNDDPTKVSDDINDGLRILGATYHTTRFYPAVYDVLKDPLNRALEAAFIRLLDDGQRYAFTHRMEQVGLPVVREANSHHILGVLATAKPAYQWKWSETMTPGNLVQFLTDDRILQFQAMAKQVKDWQIYGVINLFTWSALAPDTPKIKSGGIRIVTSSSSKVIGIPGQELNLSKVELRPFIEDVIVKVSRRPFTGHRRLVTIDALDRLSRGYNKLH